MYCGPHVVSHRCRCPRLTPRHGQHDLVCRLDGICLSRDPCASLSLSPPWVPQPQTVRQKRKKHRNLCPLHPAVLVEIDCHTQNNHCRPRSHQHQNKRTIHIAASRDTARFATDDASLHPSVLSAALPKKDLIPHTSDAIRPYSDPPRCNQNSTARVHL